MSNNINKLFWAIKEIDSPANKFNPEQSSDFEKVFSAAIKEGITPVVSANATYEGPPILNEAKELAYYLDKTILKPKLEAVKILEDPNLKKYLTEYLRRKQLVAKGHDQLFIHLPGNPEHELTQVILEFLELYENDYKYSNLP